MRAQQQPLFDPLTICCYSISRSYRLPSPVDEGCTDLYCTVWIFLFTCGLWVLRVSYACTTAIFLMFMPRWHSYRKLFAFPSPSLSRMLPFCHSLSISISLFVWLITYAPSHLSIEMYDRIINANRDGQLNGFIGKHQKLLARYAYIQTYNVCMHELGHHRLSILMHFIRSRLLVIW